MNNTRIGIGAVVLILAVIVIYFVILDGNLGSSEASPTPARPEYLSEPPDGSIPIPPAQDFAKCSVGGLITYKTENFYKSAENTGLTYSGIDNDARLIFWAISPDSGEDIDLGPNIFAGLEVPDGFRALTVIFNEEPKHKEYTLNAYVTYGVLASRSVEIVEEQCEGEVPVVIDF